MRSDGSLGFPGGMAEQSDACVVETVNREFSEEMALDLHKHKYHYPRANVSVCCSCSPFDSVPSCFPVSSSDFHELWVI